MLYLWLSPVCCSACSLCLFRLPPDFSQPTPTRSLRLTDETATRDRQTRRTDETDRREIGPRLDRRDRQTRHRPETRQTRRTDETDETPTRDLDRRKSHPRQTDKADRRDIDPRLDSKPAHPRPTPASVPPI